MVWWISGMTESDWHAAREVPNIPILQHSRIPSLHYSNTPLLQHSIALMRFSQPQKLLQAFQESPPVGQRFTVFTAQLP